CLDYSLPSPDLPSFPTRRSSDLRLRRRQSVLDDQPQDSRPFYSVSSFPDRQRRRDCISDVMTNLIRTVTCEGDHENTGSKTPLRDRKSTRLNSSHDQISYAVFCL